MAAECAPLITEAADLHQAVQQESWLPWDWSHTLQQWVSEIQRQAQLIGNEIAAMNVRKKNDAPDSWSAFRRRSLLSSAASRFAAPLSGA